MKNRILSLVIALVLAMTSLQAQNAEFKQAFTAKMLMVDYYTPVLDELASFGEMTGGVELGYLRHLTGGLNLNIPVKARAVYLPLDDTGRFLPRRLAVGIDAILQLHLFNKKRWINPYLLAGIGGTQIVSEEFNAAAPLGAGLNFRLGNRCYMQLQTEYRFGFTDNRNNWIHGLGVMFPIAKEAPAPPDTDGDGITDTEDDCPLVAGLAVLNGCPDQDSDGIADKNDDCPTEAGIAALNGCPDQDNDGIADKNDECPTVAGTVSFNGCPDTDNDGIRDGEDQCPTEAGPASNNGCPLQDADGDGIIDAEDDCPNKAGTAANRGCPDTDNDGIIDKNDKCPTEAGPASNNGCPEMKEEDKEILAFAVQNINFKTGKSTLLNSSSSILDQIVGILQRYPAYNLSIGGHTDSVGNAGTNQKLSEKRAKACFDYLVSKGISPSRMSYRGYGETQPIENNKYKDGREKNRRVEFNVFLQ